MPAYNAEAFLGQALDSLRAQTFPDYELIVIDDGSRDGTWGVIQHGARTDSRIRAFRNDANRGLVYTRNRCLDLSTAPFVALADADDIAAPCRIEKQLRFLEAHPNIGVLGGNVSFVSQAGMDMGIAPAPFLEDRHIRFFLRLGPCLWNTATMYRRSLVLEAGSYRPGFDGGAEDYDLWARLLKVTEFANLEESLATVHVHEGSVTARRKETDKNIFAVARGLLSDYLAQPLSYEEAASLVLLFYHGFPQGMNDRQALHLALSLLGRAQQVEAPDTVALLREKMSKALWVRAQERVYSDRKLSAAMAGRAAALQPRLLTSTGFAKYAARWLLPARLRCA